MEVHVELSPELEAELTKRATSAGTNLAAIIRELMTASLEADQRDYQDAVAGIQQGLALTPCLERNATPSSSSLDSPPPRPDTPGCSGS